MKYQILINSGIKRLRKAKALTQDKFAEKVGISTEALRNIEYNKYAPKADTIDNICKAFNITPFDLLLPDINQDKNLIDEIVCKLKLADNDKLKRISQIIDLIK